MIHPSQRAPESMRPARRTRKSSRWGDRRAKSSLFMIEHHRGRDPAALMLRARPTPKRARSLRPWPRPAQDLSAGAGSSGVGADAACRYARSPPIADARAARLALRREIAAIARVNGAGLRTANAPIFEGWSIKLVDPADVTAPHVTAAGAGALLEEGGGTGDERSQAVRVVRRTSSRDLDRARRPTPYHLRLRGAAFAASRQARR